MSLTSVVVPLCLGGALLAGASYGGGAGGVLSARRRGRSAAAPVGARPFGVLGTRDRAGARWATRRDLGPLRVRPDAVPAGRLLLGVRPGLWRPVGVAAESAQSLVVVGPTQSGKTASLAIPAMLGWRGPVLAASVKSDLLHRTLGTRSRCGRVWCIDPAGATTARRSSWSPLSSCTDWRQAGRVASELCEAAKTDGASADGEFWYATAAKLLAPLFLAAALEGLSMGDVVHWVDTQEAGEVAHILERRGQPEALDAAQATWCRDDRTRSSVYTTAETVLAPFAQEVPPHPAARSTPFEPGDLLGGANTLYLCAPAHDQRRLRGYFTTLTQQVLNDAFATATRAGRPLDPPLLVVLDEAAHIAPLGELDGLAATAASHGIQIVTIWQDLAQVRARYGPRAPTVLNNHRAKLFLPGIADPDTLDYASRLVGDENVTMPSVTADPGGRRSTTSSTTTRRLLPPEELRCLPKGRAVLVYGTLPPARLQLRPWWAQVSAGPGRRGPRTARPRTARPSRALPSRS